MDGLGEMNGEEDAALLLTPLNPPLAEAQNSEAVVLTLSLQESCSLLIEVVEEECVPRPPRVVDDWILTVDRRGAVRDASFCLCLDLRPVMLPTPPVLLLFDVVVALMTKASWLTKLAGGASPRVICSRMDRTILLAWSRPPLEEEAVLTGMLFGAAATSAGGVAGLSEVPARR